MRHDLENILREEFRFFAIKTMEHLGITQKEMGKRLHMSESSYSDIETGKSSCGALTEALLLDMQDDPGVFLQKLTRKFAEWYETEMLSI